MTHRAVTALIFLACACLPACSSVATLPGNLQVVDSDYPLAPADLRAIQQVARAVAPDKPPTYIQSYGADEVLVMCGDRARRKAQITRFTCRRVRGEWVVDSSSVSTGGVVVVE